MTTNPNLDQAREWAKDPSYQGDVPSVAAARVIASLPDEWIDANKLRELVEVWDQRIIQYDADLLLRDLRALLPAPQPRTLADMTPEEREACQWMQAELDGDPEIRVVISSILPAGAHVLFKDGWLSFRPGSSITPLPDLPRMVWPEEEATEEGTPLDQIGRMSMEAHQAKVMADSIEDYKAGRFVDVDLGEDTPEPDQPCPEDVPEGEVWIVECYGDRHVGTRDPNEAPNWALARMDGADTTFADDELVTLASRMVPEGERA